jgi:hypothetical protein
MTRLASLASITIVSLLAVLSSGCEKPSEESCRKAISNMQQLMGTDNLRDHAAVESEVRRCKGGSSRKSVECAINAKTLQELRTCDFYKVPENAKGIGTGEPSTAPGSAAPGSADPGTAAPGTADPGTAAPGTGDPGAAAPGTGDPGTVDPGTAAPAAPGPADPGPPSPDPGTGSPGTPAP